MTTTPIREYGAICTAVNRNSKNTGWAIQLAPRQGMTYPDTWYIQDSDPLAQTVEQLRPGQYVVLTLERGNLKTGKTGQYGAWDYWENVRGVNTDAKPSAPQDGDEPWQTPPPEYRQATGQDALQQRIAWNSAVNNATNALGVYEQSRYIDQPAGRALYRQEIMEWAQWYYDCITAGRGVNAEASSGAAETPEGQEPSLPSPQPPEALIRQSLRQWNHDHPGDKILPSDVSPRVVYRYGCAVGALNAAQALAVATACANGQILTWPAGTKDEEDDLPFA